MSEHYLVLGGHDRRAADAAPKAAMLHRAALAGVGIPAGIVIPDASYDAWCAEGCPLPDELQLTSLIIRSAFATEDNARESRAGTFLSVLRVPGGDTAAVADAVARVRASGDGIADRKSVV